MPLPVQESSEYCSEYCENGRGERLTAAARIQSAVDLIIRVSHNDAGRKTSGDERERVNEGATKGRQMPA